MQVLKLPSGKHLKRFVFWFLGRLLLALVLFSLRSLRLFTRWVADCLLSCEHFFERILGFYDSLLSLPVAAVPAGAFAPLLDIASYIDGKPVMVIGEMGSGKSTLVKYLCNLFNSSSIKVYECEGLPGDWPGCDVVGRGGDFVSIAHSMEQDISDLDLAISKRNQFGDSALSNQIYIVEEFPEIIQRVDVSLRWIDLHSRRGKKAKKIPILISQYDKVSAWGLDRKSELADSFIKIRLGKKALSYANKLADNQLLSWLQEDSSHCLVDDYPCKIPAFREMQAISGMISNQLSVVQDNGKSVSYWEPK